MVEGANVTFSYRLTNWGPGAVASSATGIYLSTNSVISTTDTLLATDTVTALGDNVGSNESVVISTDGIAPGTYYIGAIADYDDDIDEVDEKNNPSNGVQITITAAATPSSVSINNVTVIEGDNGTRVATFTVTRVGGNSAFAVDFATANGTATVADGDYVATSGTLQFGGGVNTRIISVTINGDTAFEPDQTFFVNLSGATNGATISDSQGRGTISNDDDAGPGSVSIDNVTITEGDNGTRLATFTVTRAGGTAAFAVDFATANGTATTADGDYVATSGTLQFGGGVNTRIISVTINGDTAFEPDQTFFINLSGATNGATISDSQGRGTISNDDSALFTEAADTVTLPQPGMTWSALGGDDNVTGTSGGDTVSGDGGNDHLTGGLGADSLDGGEGSDTASFMGGNGVTVSLLLDTARYGHAHGDTLDSIENLEGSDFFDELTGDTGANVLSGMGGDDFLNGSNGGDGLFGGDGDDLLIGGAGADALVGALGNDTASYANSNAAVSVDLATGAGSGGHAEGDTLFTVEVVTGSAFADALTGWQYRETLNGGNGGDLLVGSLGIDRLNGNQGNDTADYSGSGAGVGVNLLSGVGSGPGSFAEGDLLTNVENIVGSAFADNLTGTTGVNRLEGGDGADEFNASHGGDALLGEGGDDVMVGGSGADLFDGGAGSDWVYYSNAAAVSVSLAANSGAGSHAAGDSFAGIENLFGSVAADTLTGGGGGNTLNGFHGHDTLNGVTGDDVLLGGLGDDWLNGGPGDDVLSGYLGFDTFLYYTADLGRDTVIGFQDGIDRFDLGPGLDFADFTETAAGGGTRLTLTADPTNSILILGVAPGLIDAGDFV